MITLIIKEMINILYNYYHIVNMKNDKEYIDITKNQVNIRFMQHKKLLRNNKHPNHKLQKDWLDYGEENFSFSLIEQIDYAKEEDAYYHEYELISSSSKILYNIATGGKINPMSNTIIKNKMIETKQSSVPDVYQVEEVDENIFRIIQRYKSQKEIQRITGFYQGNIGRSIKKHSKSYGYYWINQEDIENNLQNWRPYRTKIRPAARLDKNDEIVEVHHNPRCFEIQNNLVQGSVSASIYHKQKLHGVKYCYIDEEQYYKLKPITLISNL